jgi:hypothetical protein
VSIALILVNRVAFVLVFVLVFALVLALVYMGSGGKLCEPFHLSVLSGLLNCIPQSIIVARFHRASMWLVS